MGISTIRLFMLLLVCCCLSGCLSDAFFGGPAYEKNLNGDYYLEAVDEYEEMALGVEIGKDGVGMIGPTVFAVGQDDNFIIAKQHPRTPPGVVDKETTNYFIIPLNFRVSKAADKNYFGPLSREQFEKKKYELKMKDSKFTTIFNELE